MSDITNRLRELAHAVAKQRWSEFSMRVPADFERDADLVLMRAADEIAQLRAENARLIADHAAALGLVADVRAAIGDDGKRMQPELVEYCGAMKRDAAAAPELADALMAFVEYNDMADSGCCDVATMIAYADALEKAHAALAKARNA